VLVAGEGARENCIGFALQKDDRVERIYIAPGNAGTYLIPKCTPALECKTVDRIIELAIEKKVAQVWVGPEGLLSQGIYDVGVNRGLDCIIGAPRSCMRLEGSKCWQKELMKKANVPVPEFRSFHHPQEVDAAFAYVDQLYDEQKDAVVKYDGYAKGKGTVVCSSREQAKWAVRAIMVDRRLGDLKLDPSNGDVEIDERLPVVAEESFFVLKNERNMAFFGTACEDKKAYDDGSSDLRFFRKFRNEYYQSFHKLGPPSGNLANIFPLTMNPNTGGMVGAAQSPYMDEDEVSRLIDTVVKPTFEAYRGVTGDEWKGIAYFGLLLTEEDGGLVRMVSEFNGRDGDTEAELRLPLLESSLFDMGTAYLEERLDEIEIRWKNDCTFGLALVSGRLPRQYQEDYSDLEDVAEHGIGYVKDQNLGYPWPHVTNQSVHGLDRVEGVHAFGAGIASRRPFVDGIDEPGEIDFCTSGGRVVVLVGEGKTIAEAEDKVYREQETVVFTNKRFRRTHAEWAKPLSGLRG
jgi:phosphoribosylamine--glycine ligase